MHNIRFYAQFETKMYFVTFAKLVRSLHGFQPEGYGFNPRPGWGLHFRRPSFATPSVDRDVKPMV